MPTMDDDEKLIAALRSYTQADEDGVMCVVSRQAADVAADRLSALKAENTALRLIATKVMPCHYCGAQTMAECPQGFPGCALADDLLIGEGEHGQELRSRLDSLTAERDRMAAALGKLADDARWWKMPEVENQEYIADACMAMLRLMRACARAALSQEPRWRQCLSC